MLRCSAAASRLRGHQPLADPDFAVGRFQESGKQPQCRGLAATGGAEQADQLAVVDLERDVITTASEANRLVRPRNSTDANPITPQVSVFALRPRARRCRPLDYRWIDISTKKAAPKSLALPKSERRLDISAIAWAPLTL